jgi:hypothetical protein
MSEQYFGDVVYEVWRGGGNPDAVSRDRVEAAEAGGAYPDETAGCELRLQRARAAVERDMREWEFNDGSEGDERFSR